MYPSSTILYQNDELFKKAASVDHYVIFMNLFSCIVFPWPGISLRSSDHGLKTRRKDMWENECELLMFLLKGASGYTPIFCWRQANHKSRDSICSVFFVLS